MRAKETGRASLPAMAEALDRNRRLWSLLAQDCASPDNALPQALRAQIISLSMWVSRHSSKVMQEGWDIDPLIDVNRSLMQGLQPQTAAAAG
jgi:flagellar protein FlaF